MRNLAALLILTLSLFALPACAIPDHIYLTWQNDLSTTMTINAHVLKSSEPCTVHYDTESRDGKLKKYRQTATGTAHQIPGLADGRWVHHIELTGLTPGETYYFVIGNNEIGFSEEKKFRTVSNDGSPLRFISGGDNSVHPRAGVLMGKAAAFNPAFGLIGGDLAYANGDLKSVRLWDSWLATWESQMVTPDGCMIPMLLAIGNHETNKEHTEPLKKAPFYFGFFPQGGKSYFTRMIGRDTVLVVLDSGHVTPHEAQREWLAQTLAQHASVPNKLAVYHVPFYPSHRSFEDSRSVAGRELWMPLFDEYGLDVAFENHDHTFKRTKRLKGNAVDPQGVLYLGDGCMGVPPRDIRDPNAWYLEKASSTPHFWVVDVEGTSMRFQAVDAHGQVFDRVPE